MRKFLVFIGATFLFISQASAFVPGTPIVAYSNVCSAQVGTYVFQAPTTSWTIPSGVTTLARVGAWGGGGGTSTTGTAGAQGGAYAEADNVSVTPGDTLTMSIGAAGQGGASGGYNSGTAGGTTTVTYSATTVVSAPGGAPGNFGTPGSGTQSGTGAIFFQGGQGGYTAAINGGNGGGGAAGPSSNGQAGTGGVSNDGGAGGAGDGGNGGAGGAGDSTGSGPGGNGSNGAEVSGIGAGGGGGGGGGNETAAGLGGVGGLAGGGAGGAGFNNTNNSPAGSNGGAGAVVVVTAGCAPSSSYTFSGPTTATVGVPNTYTLEASQTLAGNVTVTPASNNGGTFSPTTVTLPSGSPAPETFTFTPANAGTNVLSVTNSSTLANPPGINVAVSGGTVTAFYMAPSTATPPGNDSNACTISAPCLTWQKCQSEMQGSSTKTCYLRAGAFSPSSTLVLTTADNGETWSYYPGDGVDTAIMNLHSSIDGIYIDGGSNITLNGIKIENMLNLGVQIDCGSTYGFANCSGNVVENMDISGGPVNPAEGVVQGAIFIAGFTPNHTINNNYIHNVGSFGISCVPYYTPDTCAGTVIENNVVTAACTAENDCGPIYATGHGNANSVNANGVSGARGSGAGTIKNNYEYANGASGIWGVNNIYLDDFASGWTVTGNISAPLAATTVCSGCGFSGTFFLVHNGSNDTIQYNLADYGTSNAEWAGVYYGDSSTTNNGLTSDMISNVVSNNIFIGKFSGNAAPSFGSTTYNAAYYQNATYAGTVGPSAYNNYGGGQAASNGLITSDSNPQSFTTGIICTTPAAAGDSPYAFVGTPSFQGSPVNFPALATGFGPLGQMSLPIPTGCSPPT